MILIFSFLINQLQCLLLADNGIITLDTTKFTNNKKKLFELFSFPILTAGISSAILLALSKIPIVQLINFKTIGLFPLILGSFLIIAIVLDRFQKESVSTLTNNDNEQNNSNSDSNMSIPNKIDLTNKEGAKKNWRDKSFLKLFEWNKKEEADD